jgi:hypothetical protein
MKLRPESKIRNGYMLVEALVYIGVSFLLLGIGSAAMYRCIDNSVGLRRNSDDITSALHAGERWRADMRAAIKPIRLENLPAENLLHLPGHQTEILYRYSEGVIYRRVGPGAWTQLLTNIKSSTMQSDPRSNVTAWRWELELRTRARTSRIPPLFTFIAVSTSGQTP